MPWDVEMGLGSLLLQTPARQAQLARLRAYPGEGLGRAAPRAECDTPPEPRDSRSLRLRTARAAPRCGPGPGPGPSCARSADRGAALPLRGRLARSPSRSAGEALPGTLRVAHHGRAVPRCPPVSPGAARCPRPRSARARSDLRRGASGPAALATAPQRPLSLARVRRSRGMPGCVVSGAGPSGAGQGGSCSRCALPPARGRFGGGSGAARGHGGIGWDGTRWDHGTQSRALVPHPERRSVCLRALTKPLNPVRLGAVPTALRSLFSAQPP